MGAFKATETIGSNRARKRIDALQGVKLPEYSVAIGELRTELSMLKRAQEYLKE